MVAEYKDPFSNLSTKEHIKHGGALLKTAVECTVLALWS